VSTARPFAPAVKLRVDDLTKYYGRTLVLDEVDLDVAEHEVVCLIGASGSGKSTLLRCMNLLVPFDHGRILLDGVDIEDPSFGRNGLCKRIGIVFQAFNLFPHMNVIDNVTLAPRRVHGIAREEAEERGRELLARLDLAGFERKYPEQLSGGQQQRVAIVRALATNPDVLLLDEVTAALDPELVGGVLDVIRELKGSMTMVVVTHEMGFARDVADRVAFLDQGRIVELGPPDQVLVDPVQPRTRRFLQRIIDSGRL
jgi:polar amino acid transport system ATP-binding protein